MEQYAIMRFEKLKTGAPINGSVSHIARARETPNADPERRHLNRAIVGTQNASDIRESIKARTPSKFRKDAIRALEFVITATPDWFEENESQTDSFFDSAVDWLKAEFGEENVVSAVQHMDESSPHMHAIVVPRDESSGTPRLNAKSLVGGRARMRQLQSNFADWQSDFGLKRGKPRKVTQRDHTTIAEWQAGHSQLDERENDLKEREEKAAAQLQEAERLNAETRKLSSNFEQRETSIAAKEKSLNDWEKKATGWYHEHVEKFQKERSSIDARSASLDEREKRAQALESRVKDFVESQRPRELNDAEKASLRFAAMPDSQRIRSMSDYGMENPRMRDAISRLGWVSYDTGEVTKAGAEALARYGGRQQEERQAQWRAHDLPSADDAPGL